MRLQLLSDLHLETELFQPEPAPGAELLVLAGDIDSTWAGLSLFRDWPVPVLFIAGNHEFDQRDLAQTWPTLRARCESLSLRLIECEGVVLTALDGERIRFIGTVRWSDFDLFGATRRAAALRAGGYFMKVMRATHHGVPFDAAGVRLEALACRAWLEAELRQPRADWDKTVVVTHFAPSLRSADPRYGSQNGTASFCNADDDLLQHADLWIHGHLHCQFDYRVPRPQGGSTRVVCNARGHSHRGEARGHCPLLVLDV